MRAFDVGSLELPGIVKDREFNWRWKGAIAPRHAQLDESACRSHRFDEVVQVGESRRGWAFDGSIVVPHESEDDIEAVLGCATLRLDRFERQSDIAARPKEPLGGAHLDRDDRERVGDAVEELPSDPYSFVSNCTFGALAFF